MQTNWIHSRFPDPCCGLSFVERYSVLRGSNTMLFAIFVFQDLLTNLAEGSYTSLSGYALSSSQGFKILGNTGDDLGHSVCSAGDFNNDGHPDIIVGAPESDYGSAYLFFSNATTRDLNVSAFAGGKQWGIKFEGNYLYGNFGISVGGGGDVNGDGFDDVVVGAYSGSGTVYVYFGFRPTAISTTITIGTFAWGSKGFRVNSNEYYFGKAVAIAGDVNNDGYDDVLISSPLRSGCGQVLVIFGHSNATTFSDLHINTFSTGSLGFRVTCESSGADNEYLGNSVSGAGDFNDDGIDDYLIGATHRSTIAAYAGVVYVLFGKTCTTSCTDIALSAYSTSTSRGFRIWGVENGQMGLAVGAAGDVNGDGKDDIIVGMPYAGGGWAYVLFGKTGWGSADVYASSFTSSDTFGFVISGGGNTGYSVDGAGDINDDGFDDVVVGSLGGTKVSTTGGEGLVYFGKASGYSAVSYASISLGTEGFVVYGAYSGDRSGWSVAGIGDFNRDGVDDVAIGFPFYRYPIQNSPTSGATAVILGRKPPPTAMPTIMPSVLPSQAPSAKPTVAPTCAPTRSPSTSPTAAPSRSPTMVPTIVPSVLPSQAPSAKPTVAPTCAPTPSPSTSPTAAPSSAPTMVPTALPSEAPSTSPTSAPTEDPTINPTAYPTPAPTMEPTRVPTMRPSSVPTVPPTTAPTTAPTEDPTAHPTQEPTIKPTMAPSPSPTATPTAVPTPSPSTSPTAAPSSAPTMVPTVLPSEAPSTSPTSAPTEDPTINPTVYPTPVPTMEPTLVPTMRPSSVPTVPPTTAPTTAPTEDPTAHPTQEPTIKPTMAPTPGPTATPTAVPTLVPTAAPTIDSSILQRMLSSPTYKVRNGYAFAVLAANTTVYTWGEGKNGGDSSAVSGLLSGSVTSVVPSLFAFAAMRSAGARFAAWGVPQSTFGAASIVSFGSTLSGLAANEGAFAAVDYATGALVTFGSRHHGGNITLNALEAGAVLPLPTGFISITASAAAFAGLRSDGSVYSWGNSIAGGGPPFERAVSSLAVVQVVATREAFAARTTAGGVVTWGSPRRGGDSSGVQAQLQHVVHLVASRSVFAAFTRTLGLVVWGERRYGGDVSTVQAALSTNVAFVTHTFVAMAAMKVDGSVVAWGATDGGGDTLQVQAQLTGTAKVFGNSKAFAALNMTGGVVAWGKANYGGEIPADKAAALSSRVVSISHTDRAFAALKNDGSVVAWGQASHGGVPGAAVEALLSSGVHTICANDVAFSAIKTDGSVVSWGHEVSVSSPGVQFTSPALVPATTCAE